MRQPVPRALALAHDLLSLAERSCDPARIAIACRALGYSLCIAGEQGGADLVLARGIALAGGSADTEFGAYGEDPRIICRINRGTVLCFLGYPETALRIAQEGLARARARNNPHAVAWSLVSLADIHIFLRNATGAEQAAAEAIDVARQHRLVQWLARAPQRRGWALCQLGNTHQGLALLEDGLRCQHATGHMLGTTRANCYLAEGCLLAGKPETALEHVEAARRHAETHEEHYLSAEIHRLHAEILQTLGAPTQEIECHLHSALNVARSQAARLWELRAASSFARLWRDHGRRDEARGLLAPVYGWFTEGFHTPDLLDSRALLDELAVE
jgi:predicted ATPase